MFVMLHILQSVYPQLSTCMLARQSLACHPVTKTQNRPFSHIYSLNAVEIMLLDFFTLIATLKNAESCGKQFVLIWFE